MYTKLFLSLIAILLCSQEIFSQNTGYGQSNPPPSPSIFGSSFPFIRGMYVDCADVIIGDMVAGNPDKKDELVQYVTDNSIRYLAFFRLDNGLVIGNSNPAYEAALVSLIIELRDDHPDIQIGAVCTSTNFMQQTSPVFINDGSLGMSSACDPIHERIAHYDSLLDPKSLEPSSEEIQTSEVMKSVYRAAKFSGEGGGDDGG